MVHLIATIMLLSWRAMWCSSAWKCSRERTRTSVQAKFADTVVSRLAISASRGRDPAGSRKWPDLQGPALVQSSAPLIAIAVSWASIVGRRGRGGILAGTHALLQTDDSDQQGRANIPGRIPRQS
jgi:hypothetical protein